MDIRCGTTVSMSCCFSAWQRRSSILEKTDKKDALAMREAKEEALRLQEAISAALEDRDDHDSDIAPVRLYTLHACCFNGLG